MSLAKSKRKDDSEISSEDGSKKRKRFNDLIRSRRQGNRNLSETSKDVLQEAVFQLINLHQDTHKLVSEALESCKPLTNDGKEEKKYLLPNVLQSLSQLESQSDQSITLSVTEECSHRLLSCARSRSQNISEWKTCLYQINTVIRQNKFNKQHFVNIVAREQVLPLHILWSLHTQNLLPLSSYLTRKMTEPGFVQTFSGELYKLYQTQTGQEEPDSTCISGIMSILINSGFPEKKEKEASLRRLSVAILDAAVRSILDESREECVLQPFIRLTSTGDTLNSLSFKRYCTHTMSLLMSHRPSLKVSQAFKQQANWKFAKVSEKISNLYKQLFLPFECGEVLEVLQRILERQEVNWQTVLSFIATFLLSFSQGTKLIQGHICSLLSEGLEEGDMEGTIIGFLLARQSCLEGLHVFPQYQDWFQQTFSDSNRSPAGSRKAFTFLIKFLTNIVPYESAQHLKVHILRPPHVPAKCRDLFTEYVALAKTRLTDLKESCDIAGGIYDSSNVSSDKQVDPVEADVERSLTAFQTTGKVPSTVMEASIFRKPYFVGRYLKSLLTPRHLPDMPDTRMKMIESLKKADKIPGSMYSKYEEACRKESKMLLEGVFEVDSDDDAMQDAMLSPLEQLEFRLEQLRKVIIEDVEQKHGSAKLRVPELVSILSEKLETLLQVKQSPKPEEAPPVGEIHLQVHKPDLSQRHLQIVDTVLNGICETVTSDLSSSSPSLSWLSQVVKMISQHKHLHRPLLQRVFSLVIDQGHDLSKHHMTGLSALVAQVSTLQGLFGPIRAQCCDQHQSYRFSGLIECLAHGLQIRSGSDINTAFRFLTSYLQHMFLQYTCHTSGCSSNEEVGVVPERVCKLFCLLCWRLVPETRETRETKSREDTVLKGGAALSIYNSTVYRTLLDKSQVTFEDWCNFEISLAPEEDVLTFSERQVYYHWAVFSHFLSHDIGGAAGVSQLATTLLESLVNIHEADCFLPPSCRKCEKGGNSVRDSSSDFLTLLQMILTHLPPSTSESWLTGYLRGLVTMEMETDGQDGINNITNNISVQTRVTAAFRVICCLPPHLLIANQLTDTPTHCAVSRLAALLDSIMAPYLSEGVFLPAHLTLYLAQCFRCFTENENINKELLEHPLVAVSILVHWPLVESVVKSEEKSQFLSEFSGITAWVERWVHKGTIESHPAPVWLCGAALVANGYRNPETVSTITDMLCRTGGETGMEITYAELCLLYLAGQFVHVSASDRGKKSLLDGSKSSLSQLLKTFPSLIRKLDEGCQLETQVASTSATSLKKTSLLISVCEIEVEELVSMMNTSPCLLNTAVRLYGAVCQQFHQSLDGKCASLVQLSKCAELLKQVLRTVEADCLQVFDQETLRLAGSDFLHLVRSRTR